MLPSVSRRCAGLVSVALFLSLRAKWVNITNRCTSATARFTTRPAVERYRVAKALRYEGAQQFVELGLLLEAYPWRFGGPDVPFLDGDVVGEAAEGLEDAGV